MRNARSKHPKQQITLIREDVPDDGPSGGRASSRKDPAAPLPAKVCRW